MERLSTGGIKDELTALRTWFQEFDLEAMRALEAGPETKAFHGLRPRIFEGADEVERVLSRIAHELRLVPSAVS